MQTWNLESNDFGTEASGKTNLEHWETFKQTTVNFFGKHSTLSFHLTHRLTFKLGEVIASSTYRG
jgi:hypothetical protein